ncbi:hypothetical protein ACLOJK_012772 [Asimina triloba]
MDEVCGAWDSDSGTRLHRAHRCYMQEQPVYRQSIRTQNSRFHQGSTSRPLFKLKAEALDRLQRWFPSPRQLINMQQSLLPLSPFSVAFLLLPICVLLLSYKFLLKRDPSRSKKLPPGSMGWPYIGETLKLYTQNPNTFFSTKRKRYGDIFKTHILGCPCIFISKAEAVRVILGSRGHLFKPTYPPSKEKIIGPEAIFFHQGEYHARIKKLVQAAFLPCSIKRRVSEIEGLVLRLIPGWENLRTINTLHEMKRFAFDAALLAAFGPREDEDLERQTIEDLYHCLERGYNAMPLNLPGTPFHKALKARKLLHEILRRIIEKRREEKKENGGLLGVLLGSDNTVRLSDSQVADNIIGVIFAAHDTTASVLTWVFKYLADDKHLLESVTKEQEQIQLRMIKEKRSSLTWDDTRRMLLTSRVIQETLRASSILSFTFREAVEDVELEGYLIPRGWKVLPLFRSIHHSSDFFPRPDVFDPSRFEVAPRPNTFLPFGSGVHSCPGSELAKLEMLVLLHHFTTKFRTGIKPFSNRLWDRCGPSIPSPAKKWATHVLFREDAPNLSHDYCST